MSWLDHHQRSEWYAAKAEAFVREGDARRAEEFYALAAEKEVHGLEAVATDKPRTYGVTAVSAVSLYFKASDWDNARALAHRCLGSGRIVEKSAVHQLENLLDSIRYRQAGLDLDSAQMLVSAKGGDIQMGGAPLDLVMAKTQKMNTFIYRTAELMKDIPHRKRGGPDKEILETYQPWLIQAPPGSYQFTVALQQTRLLDLAGPPTPPQQIMDRLFGIIYVCATSPWEGLPKEVPDDEYADTFLKLTRDLAPTAKGRFTQLHIQARPADTPIILRSEIRDNINDVFKEKRTSQDGENEEDIHGILRALHLDKDWIEVVTPDGRETFKIDGAGEEVDDRIGPMVNHLVVVQTKRRGQKLTFIDIEAEE